MQTTIHMLHLKNKHYYLHARQKLMIFLLNAENHISITMSICNLIKYVDNYSDISGSLWQLKKDEIPDGNVDFAVDNNGIFNFHSFKYKAALLEKAENVGNNTNSSIKVQK